MLLLLFVFVSSPQVLKTWLKMQQTVSFRRGDSGPRRAGTVTLKVGVLQKEASGVVVQPCHVETSSFTSQGSPGDTSTMTLTR